MGDRAKIKPTSARPRGKSESTWWDQKQVVLDSVVEMKQTALLTLE